MEYSFIYEQNHSPKNRCYEHFQGKKKEKKQRKTKISPEMEDIFKTCK